MISTIKIDELPQFWDDGIDWSVNADVTLRHFLAIVQAIGERKSLSLGYTCPYLNDVISAYYTKTYAGIEWICNKLYNEFVDLLIGDPFNRFDRSMNLGSLGSGYVCHNFTNPYQPNSTNRICPYWLPPNYDIPEEPITKRLLVSVNVIQQLQKEYLSTIRCSPEINKYSHIQKSYKPLIKWLSELKRSVSSINRIFCTDLMTSGGEYAPGYYLAERGFSKEELNKTEQFSDPEKLDYGTKIGEMHPFDSNQDNIYCKFSSGDSQLYPDRIDYSYEVWNGLCPVKFKNISDFSFEFLAHVYAAGFIQDGYQADREYTRESEFFGLPVSQRGWNSLAELAPNQSTTIVPESFADPNYMSQKFKCWKNPENRYYIEYYGVEFDGFILYFYTNDNNGFRF